MDVGVMMGFTSYGWDDCSDQRVWDEEIRLARLAADLGFDCLWSAEHHFNDYSFIPDNEFLGEHFKTVKGYDAYQQKAEIARKGGLEGAVAGFMQAASWGTPDGILRGLEERRRLIGDFELNVAFRFGGMPYEVSERGLKLFAKEVLPVLKAQTPAEVKAAAE